MALPLSILLSTIMTYGSLGENYELVAIKSAGISLVRAMYPMIIIVSILSISAFIFSDYMLPVANLKYFSLLYDVRQQRSASLLPEGVFSNSFPGYTIRVEKKGADGQALYGIIIYQKDDKLNNINVTRAKEGRMYRTARDQYLVLKLNDGVRYEESAGDGGGYNARQRLMRFRFKETEQKFDLSAFKLKRTDQDAFKSAFQMMNLKQLRDYKKDTQHRIDSTNAQQLKTVLPYMRYFAIPNKSATIKKYIPGHKNVLDGLKLADQLSALSNASSEIRSINNMMKNNLQVTGDQEHDIRRSTVEYQKKYTLSAVCLVLFLIGAPLGAIIRKGGLGLPVVVSVAFFLIYYIISTIGEKSVKDGDLSPIVGMWISIFILTPIGLFLSYKATTDSALFDMDLYKRFFNKIFKSKEAVQPK